jgi:hypothetical protein
VASSTVNLELGNHCQVLLTQGYQRRPCLLWPTWYRKNYDDVAIEQRQTFREKLPAERKNLRRQTIFFDGAFGSSKGKDSVHLLSSTSSILSCFTKSSLSIIWRNSGGRPISESRPAISGVKAGWAKLGVLLERFSVDVNVKGGVKTEG